jgi:hypothetical protein
MPANSRSFDSALLFSEQKGSAQDDTKNKMPETPT